MVFKEEFPMRRTRDQLTEEQEIIRIFDQARYIHWGINDKNSAYPYVVTTDYGYEYLDGTLMIYIHGAPKGRKLDLIKENPQVGFTLHSDTSLWRPAKEKSCHFTTNYKSVIGTAKAEILEDLQEKAHGLTLLLRHETGEIFSETDYHPRELAHVQVIKFVVQHLSAKQHFKA